MILGIGNDIIEVKRIAQSIQRHGSRFLDKLFTSFEQKYCLKYREPERHFAGRFAAKEAIAKALGTGFGEDVHWLDIEILNNDLGKPIVKFDNQLLLRYGKIEIQLSISHCREYATAVALAIKDESCPQVFS
jgi:holo-[acyl-carrier protein] synthase